MKMMRLTNQNLADIARELRKELMELHHQSKSPHIGSEFSCLDILVALYWGVIKPDDNFILSKSHAGIALYAVLHKKGIISDEDYKSFHHDGSQLAEHITYPIGYFKGGSLGHGLAHAIGLAHAKRLNKEKGRVYCIVGDGELQEGSTLESIDMASRLGIDNLVLIIDNNSFGAYQRIEEKRMDQLAESIRPFYNVKRIDGNNYDEILGALGSEQQNQLPLCIFAKTVMAKGVPGMEDQQRAHYHSPSDKEMNEGIR